MNRTQAGKLSLFAITWPIFIEFGLQMLMRTTDTFMLSRVSDDAVAAVGVSNQIIMFAMLLFNFVGMGSAVVVSQYLGARRFGDIGRLVGSSLAINFLFGLFVSMLVVLGSGALLGVFSLSPALYGQAQSYLYIAGGGLVVQSLLIASVAIIQAHGLTRQTMLVALGMNLLNVIGNYLFIFGPFGFPQLGVTGVAISTLVSQCVGLAVNLFLLGRAVGRIRWGHLIRWQRDHVGKVLRVGVPSSLINLSYNANQFVTTAFISSLGASALTTRIYTQNIMFIVMILCISLGRGTQIIVGHMVGAGEREEAYRAVMRNFRFSLLATLCGVAVVSLFRTPLLGMFTDSAEIVKLGAALLLLGFLLEPGRNMNIMFERSLQAAGDARFAATSSVLIMWLFSVPLTYLLGIHLGYGLYGIWAAFIVDEWLRGFVLMQRWRSRVWERKSLVDGNAKKAGAAL